MPETSSARNRLAKPVASRASTPPRLQTSMPSDIMAREPKRETLAPAGMLERAPPISCAATTTPLPAAKGAAFDYRYHVRYDDGDRRWERVSDVTTRLTILSRR